MDLCVWKDLSLNRNYKTSIDDLPDELLVNILSRLSVKTLIRLTCVCKLWYSIINTPYFVSVHLSSSMADPSKYYTLISRSHSSSLIAISHNSFIISHPDFKFLFETQSIDAKLVSACKGLICFTDSDLKHGGRNIYLTNPFIHKYKRLDVESSCYVDLIKESETTVDFWEMEMDINNNVDFEETETLTYVNVGFGYSENENDYKVIRIIMRTKHHVDYIGYEITTKVEIYSLNSGKWKALDGSIAIENNGKRKVQDIEIAAGIPPVYVDGCLYWHGAHLDRKEDYPKEDEYILCFDLKDELFRRIELPNTYHQLSSTRHSNIFVKNGSLAIVLCTKHTKSDSTLMRICLLMLEQKFGEQVQWKEFNYECPSFPTYLCKGFGAMGLNGDERLLFVTYSDFSEECIVAEYIIAVDLDNTCTIERFELNFGEDVIIHKAINVFESLVSFSE